MVDDVDSMMQPVEALLHFTSPLTLDVSQAFEKQADNQKRYGFRLENIGILIPENTMSEVMINFQIYPLPKTQAWMKGLVNLRGNLIPVYDFALLLGLTDSAKKYENLLILDTGEESIGLLIASLPLSCDVISWNKDVNIPKMAMGLSEYVTEVYISGDIIWLGFDHKNYFHALKDIII